MVLNLSVGATSYPGLVASCLVRLGSIGNRMEGSVPVPEVEGGGRGRDAPGRGRNAGPIPAIGNAGSCRCDESNIRRR